MYTCRYEERVKTKEIKRLASGWISGDNEQKIERQAGIGVKFAMYENSLLRVRAKENSFFLFCV